MDKLTYLAINTAIFDGHDMHASLKIIRKLGVRYVEFAFNQGYVGQLDDQLFSLEHAAHLRDLLDKEQLQTQALGCTMNLGAPDAVEQFQKRIEFAAALGARFLNTCTGAVADRGRIIENLRILAPLAAQKNCVICLENGGDHNFNAFATIQDGLQLLKAVGSDAVALNYDPGNTVSLVPNVSPSEEARMALPFCQHFHVKDVQVHDDRFTFPALGEGIIDYPELIRTIDGRGMPFSIEKPLRMHRRKDTFAVRDRVPISMAEIEQSLQRSLTYLRTCLE